MATTSRKRTQATQGGREANGRLGQLRDSSKRQRQRNDDDAAKLQATIQRQNKELAKQRQMIAEYKGTSGANGNGSASEDEENSELESQDENDLGHGARPGGGFTSAISSKGIVPHGQSAPKRLTIETNPFPTEQDRVRSSAPRLSSPISSLPHSSFRAQSSPTPHLNDIQHGSEHMTPASSHRHPTPTLSRESSVPLATSSESLRERVTPRSSLPPSSLPPSSPQSRSSTTLLPAPFRQGSSPGPKPKAADYAEGIEKMLLDAMHEYSCLILTIDAFPNEVKQTQWAKTTWQAACEKVGEYYECSPRMIRLITGRSSWARGILKDAARNNFKTFKFKEGLSEEVKRYNQDLRHTLLRDDAFHHKNQEAVTGFAEHRVILDILKDALFEDNKCYGVKYSRYFNPISINTLALVFTMIEFLINEWSTGQRVKATFRSKVHYEKFEAHRLRTQQWCELEPIVTTNIRKRMFRTLMKKAGATDDTGEGVVSGMTESMRKRAREALAGRTGETDDEDEKDG